MPDMEEIETAVGKDYFLPDVLVKGGDYRPEDIAGGQCVKEKGGDVIVLDYIEGCSTTRIINSLKEEE